MRFRIIFCFLLGCMFTAQAYRPLTDARPSCIWVDTAQDRLDSARKRLEKEFFNSAINLLNEADNILQRCPVDTGAGKNLQLEIYYWLGYAYFQISAYERSSFYFYSILKSAPSDSYIAAKAYTGIANVANARRAPDEARKALNKVLQINEKLQDDALFLSVYNNLSNTFSVSGSYDTALIYLEKAYEKSFRVQDSARRISIMLNMANNLQIQQKWEEAEYYYKKALREAERQNNRHEICQVEYGLAVAYMKMGENRRGLELLESCLRLASEMNYNRIEMLVYDRLGRYYEEEGDYRQAYLYARKGRVLNDSIFNIESERNINQLRADFDLYQIETAKQLLERDLAIYKSKIFRRNVNLVVLAALVLAIAVLAFWITRKLLNRNKEYSSLRSDLDTLYVNANEEKRQISERFQSELDEKQRRLVSRMLLSIKSEEAAADILKRVKLLKISSKGKTFDLLSEIEALAKELQNPKGLEEFQYSFEHIHAGFYERLNQRYPGLTAGDRRLAALLVMELTTKEIATITNRSVRGVETSKFRLKKKMNLDAEQNLTEILLQLK